MMKLKINKETKERFEEMLQNFPFIENYKKLIEKELNCPCTVYANPKTIEVW